MTKEKFEKAKELEKRIDHISKVIDLIAGHDSSLDQPIMETIYAIYVTYENWIGLNEGEFALIQKALEDEKFRLCQEFVML